MIRVVPLCRSSGKEVVAPYVLHVGITVLGPVVVVYLINRVPKGAARVWA